MSKVLGNNDLLWFGKHKNKSVKYILNHNPSYLRWILKKKIQDISFSEDVIIPERYPGNVFSVSTESYTDRDIDREFYDQRRNEYPSSDMDSDGDYYPDGCNIYGLG